MPEQSTLERTFLTRLIQLAPGLPEPTAEYQFAPGRKWRFDFAWVDHKIAVEIEGMTSKIGRHQRRDGYAKDCEKYNAALVLGWRVLRFTGQMIDADPIKCMGQLVILIAETTSLGDDGK